MKLVTVASRYARALFLVTEKRKETVRALEDLKGAFQVLTPGTRAANFLASPQVRLGDKRRVLRSGFHGKVAPAVAVFLDLLLRKRRLDIFTEIAAAFEALVEEAQNIRRAHVVSAVPLTPAETERLHEALEGYTHKKIKLTSELNPSVLGGVLVRIGDRVVDRTVRTLLDAIAQQLHEVSV